MKKAIYKNRYNDVFTFTELEDGNILWEGNFKYCRIGMPNDYTKAYKKYLKTEGIHDHTLSMEEFKDEVHRQLYDEDKNWIGPCKISELYAPLVESIKDKIDMVDPNGGPYLILGQKINGKIIKEFIKVKKGYKIIVESKLK